MIDTELYFMLLDHSQGRAIVLDGETAAGGTAGDGAGAQATGAHGTGAHGRTGTTQLHSEVGF